MTLTAPDRSELSMFFTNESEEPRIYNVQIKDMAFQDAALSTVITRGPSGRQSYDANWFQRGKTIRCSKNKHGIFTVKVPPQSIMTVTTLDTSWVNGVNTFSGIQPPSSARLTLPTGTDWNTPRRKSASVAAHLAI